MPINTDSVGQNKSLLLNRVYQKPMIVAKSNKWSSSKPREKSIVLPSKTKLSPYMAGLPSLNYTPIQVYLHNNSRTASRPKPQMAYHNQPKVKLCKNSQPRRTPSKTFSQQMHPPQEDSREVQELKQRGLLDWNSSQDELQDTPQIRNNRNTLMKDMRDNGTIKDYQLTIQQMNRQLQQEKQDRLDLQSKLRHAQE